MPHLVALFAGCLLYPPANDPCHEARQAQYEFLRNHRAAQIEWANNAAVKLLKDLRGVVLPSGIGGFQIDKPALELLDKIGPALLARGTEELRVTQINRHTRLGTEINLRQFIRGREVIHGFMTVLLNEQTNEITFISGYFLPDRGLEHEPRLTAPAARTNLEAELREVPYQDWHPTFLETPARLAYSFEQMGAGGGVGGALVWVFPVRFPPAGGEEQIGDLNANAATGKITPPVNVLVHWSR